MRADQGWAWRRSEADSALRMSNGSLARRGVARRSPRARAGAGPRPRPSSVGLGVAGTTRSPIGQLSFGEWERQARAPRERGSPSAHFDPGVDATVRDVAKQVA